MRAFWQTIRAWSAPCFMQNWRDCRIAKYILLNVSWGSPPATKCPKRMPRSSCDKQIAWMVVHRFAGWTSWWARHIVGACLFPSTRNYWLLIWTCPTTNTWVQTMQHCVFVESQNDYESFFVFSNQDGLNVWISGAVYCLCNVRIYYHQSEF